MKDSDLESLTTSATHTRLSTPFFSRMFERILAAGRGMLERQESERRDAASLADRCQRLLTHRGDASGLALAHEIVSLYEELPQADRIEFFGLLSRDFAIDRERVLEAAARYRDGPSLKTVTELRKSLDAPLKRLFRRLNTIPGGTKATVEIREELLGLVAEHPELAWLEADLRQLLIEWFNRGFLALDRIDWDSPARVLERIIAYEAVHEINGWDDLRNRLRQDRRCFAFFHMAIPDDPVIFLQVALTNGLASSIAELLAPDRDVLDQNIADTAVFYSISNCHKGLQGISFGHFLIKQVVELLRQELDNIRQFATLSPVPGFRRWLKESRPEALSGARRSDWDFAHQHIDDEASMQIENEHEVREALLRLAAWYLVEAKRGDQQPLDSVARFHLANGASIERLCWAGDLSEAGIRRSYGIMVNYAYDPKAIEKNHERYFQANEIATSSAVKKLVGGR